MIFTGERYVPELDMDDEISIYHMQRYISIKDICKDKDVLDAASGEGYGSRILSEVAKTVKGIDISEEAVINANTKYANDSLNYYVASVGELPFENDSFDVVVSYETIEHVDENIQQKFILEIERVLRDDGILIMSSPDKKNYSDIPNFNNEYHVHELYYDEFVDLLKSRFDFVETYYQGMHCNSYIFDKNKGLDETYKKIELKEREETRAEYIIAVCSKQPVNVDISSFVADTSNRYYKIDSEIKVLKERLGEPGEIIEQKENYIQEQRVVISDRDNKIRELNGVIEQKENYIGEQRNIISDRDNTIRELNGTIEQKENYICEQRGMIGSIEKEKEMLEKEKNLIEIKKEILEKEKNEAIDHLYHIIESQDGMILHRGDVIRDMSGREHLKAAARKLRDRFKKKLSKSGKKKIGILNPFLPTLGGGEKHMGYLCQFIEEYYNNKVDIDIIVFHYNDINIYSPDYVTIDKVNKQFGLNLKKTKLRKINLSNPSVAIETIEQRQIIENISSEYDVFINFQFQSKHIGKAKVNIYECMFPPKRMEPMPVVYPSYRPIEHQHDEDFLNSYQVFISNSEYTNHWNEVRWQVGDKQRIIYPPVFAEKEIEGKYQEDKKKNIIMSVGRFFVGAHSKKQLDLVKFFVNHQDVFKDYEYHLAGAVATLQEDVDYLNKIKAIASTVNNVFIHENCPFDELMDLYSKAKIFWHGTGYGVDENAQPEKMEHFGITPVEAMSYGVIPVVINKGGPKETVIDGEIGYCWNTEEECVAKTKLLIDDDELRRQMAVKATVRAKEYSIEKFYERHRKVFNELQI